MLPIGS